MATPLPSSSASAGQDALPDIDLTFGMLLIGLIVSTGLFGALTVQTRFYYKRFTMDQLWIKRLVAVVWLLDLMQCIFGAGVCYHYLVTRFGSTDEPRVTWIASTVILFEPMTAVLVQLYFARRFWLLNYKRDWLVASVMVALSLAAFCAGITTGALTYTVPYFSDFHSYMRVVVVWLICSTVCDFIVTASVTWALLRSKTGFETTDRVVTRIAIWTCNTGALTSAVAIINIVTFVALKDTLIYLAAHFVLTKLYSNTLLASLNRRRKWIPDAHGHPRLERHHYTEDVEEYNPRSGSLPVSVSFDSGLLSQAEKPNNASRDRTISDGSEAAPGPYGLQIAMITTTVNYADSILGDDDVLVVGPRKSASVERDSDISEAERRALSVNGHYPDL